MRHRFIARILIASLLMQGACLCATINFAAAGEPSESSSDVVLIKPQPIKLASPPSSMNKEQLGDSSLFLMPKDALLPNQRTHKQPRSSETLDTETPVPRIYKKSGHSITVDKKTEGGQHPPARIYLRTTDPHLKTEESKKATQRRGESARTIRLIRPKRTSKLAPTVVGSMPGMPQKIVAGEIVLPIASSEEPPVVAPHRPIDTPALRRINDVGTAARLNLIQAPEVPVSSPSIQAQRRVLNAGQPKVKWAIDPANKTTRSPALIGPRNPIPSERVQRPESTGVSHSAYITDQDLSNSPSKIRKMAGEEEIQIQPGQPSAIDLVPVQAQPIDVEVHMQQDDELMSLDATSQSLPGVLRLIAEHHNLNLVVGPEVKGDVTFRIRGARYDEILDAILSVHGFAWHKVGNLLYVTGGNNSNMSPRAQGKQVVAYPLDYVAATDVEAVANQIVSPIGNAFVSEAAENDQTKTREILIVDDTPDAHARISEYISQIDVPPRQVLVEAHVLQVALSDDDRHGINLTGLANLEGARLSVTGAGFADENVGGPSLALRVDGTDMDALVELIQQNTNSRTLASPKVSVVNHQEARIQIGQRLPYAVATTTQTSTIQSVEFLEVGIVLTVLPIITEDGNVLMTVSPKVSGGRITESGFPEEDTTELSTTILMPDGGGIVIGGLIREEDVQTRSFVPGIGKVPVLGNLFKRRTNSMRRNELVVALVTHVLPEVDSARTHEMQELQNTLPEYAQRDLQHSPYQVQSHHVIQQAKRPTVTKPSGYKPKPSRAQRRPAVKSRRR